MDIGIRRLILVVVSVGGGIGLTFGMLAGLDALYGNVDLEHYGTIYFVLTALPLAVLVGIWLDYFLKTRLLSAGPEEESKASTDTGSE